MNDILSKVRAEIEKLIEQTKPYLGACAGQVVAEANNKIAAYNEVLAILDTMQEEPISVWHNASEEPDNKKNIVIWAKGFSNLIAVDEYRPKEKKFYYEFGDHYYNVDITRKGLIWAYVDELLNLTKKQEPVSEDLEKAADDYAVKVYNDYLNDPKAFAEKDADELNVEIFKAGANWQKEQMMAKAVNATVHIDAGNYPYIPQIELYDYDKDIPLAKEGDKYKVVLIKED